MLRQLNLLILGILLTGLCHSYTIFAQEQPDPETEYYRIRELAFSGDYSGAAAAARILVNTFPDYGDARILLGRILAWQKDYKQAAAVMDTLLMKEPDNQDALSARRDITLWAKENTPVATDIRAGYYFDTFSKPYSRFWQVFKAGAGHKFRFGQASASLNIGNITIDGSSPQNATELQGEVEAYPRLSNKNYAYLNYAYSPGSFFPRHRAAAELWQVLPAGWEISTGLNYYHFDRDIYIALASVEKYLGKFWLSVKTFVYFKDEGPTTSFYFNARGYFNDRNYLQITLGTGTAPDEPFDIQSDLERLSAHSIRLTGNFSLTSRLLLRIGAGYSREEYQEEIWRNRFEGTLNLIYAIKMK